MAINVNSSETKFFSESVLYTGIANVKVLAINPDLSQLQEIGYNFKSEPVYLSENDEGIKKVRIDVYVGNEKVKTKLVFFLENKDNKSKKSGASEYTNSFAQNSWGQTAADCTSKVGKNGKPFFKDDGVRVAKTGEVGLYQFLADWLNINPDDSIMLDKFQALFQGDYKELQLLVKSAKDNTFWTLLSVNSGKYQNALSQCVVRGQFALASAVTRISGYIKKQSDAGYSPFKSEDSYTLEFKEYMPSGGQKGTLPDPDAPVVQPKMKAKNEVDDLPF